MVRATTARAAVAVARALVARSRSLGARVEGARTAAAAERAAVVARAPSPAHGRQSDAVQDMRMSIGAEYERKVSQRGKVSKTDTHWWPLTKPGALLPFG